MLINKYTKIVCKNVVLVPYRKEHVPKYHGWMKSAELQELTGSEPLSLEEEYEMQESWSRDTDKCTFIVLDKAKYDTNNDELAAMVGDTNLFFLNADARSVAEAEIMIAEHWARGRRLGWEATLAMLRYGVEYLEVAVYTVKIKVGNVISIGMFESMGFVEVSRSAVFGEVTLEQAVNDTWKHWLRMSCHEFTVINEND